MRVRARVLGRELIVVGRLEQARLREDGEAARTVPLAQALDAVVGRLRDAGGASAFKRQRLVTEVGAALDTVVTRLKKHGKDVPHLPKAVRKLESKLRGVFAESQETDKVHWIIDDGIDPFGRSRISSRFSLGECAAAQTDDLRALGDKNGREQLAGINGTGHLHRLVVHFQGDAVGDKTGIKIGCDPGRQITAQGRCPGENHVWFVFLRQFYKQGANSFNTAVAALMVGALFAMPASAAVVVPKLPCNLLVASACSGLMPVPSNTGKAIKPPPPAMLSSVPASRPVRKSRPSSSIDRDSMNESFGFRFSVFGLKIL